MAFLGRSKVPQPPQVDADIKEILTLAQTGDREAFGLIYDRYRSEIYRYIRARVGNRQLAEDLTADTFLRALKRIGSFTWQGRDLGAWLVTIARNLVADHFKSGRYRREFFVDEWSWLELPTADKFADPSNVVLLAEKQRRRRWTNHRIRIAILTLNSDSQREAMLYRYADGLSVEETAAAMGMTPSAVKSLCHRATTHLAIRLRHLTDDLLDEVS